MIPADATPPLFPVPLPGRVRTKICGLTSLESARQCAAAGADAIGINFFPGSKRYQSFSKAAPWLADMPAGLARVGVFVNLPAGELEVIAGSGLLDVLQFHGDESRETLAAARRFGLPIIKALPLLPGTTTESLTGWPADALLLDAHAPGTYGGTGHTIDWNHAARVIAALAPLPVILSGGLHPGNIAEAIRLTRPAGVDVASGVESSPGQKDPDKVTRFIHQARLP
jgi:phosphoribosylanthranilate isomerase